MEFEQLLTRKQVAEIFQVRLQKKTLRGWDKLGVLHPIRLGANQWAAVRYDPREIEKLLGGKMEPLRTLKTDQVAQLLQVSERTVRRLCKMGKLRGIDLSHRVVRFSPLEIERFIASQGQAATVTQ